MQMQAADPFLLAYWPLANTILADNVISQIATPFKLGCLSRKFTNETLIICQ